MIMEFTWNLLSQYTLEYITDRYVAIDTITITINKISVKKHCYNSFKVMKERLEQDQLKLNSIQVTCLDLHLHLHLDFPLDPITMRNQQRSGFIFALSFWKTFPVLQMYFASSFSELNFFEMTLPAVPASTRSTRFT